MKLFGCTKKLIDEAKNGENFKPWSSWSSFSQFNLADSQYQQKSDVLYTFMPNKSYAFLLNVEPSNLVFLITCNTVFDEFIRTFTDQNGRALEIK